MYYIIGSTTTVEDHLNLSYMISDMIHLCHFLEASNLKLSQMLRMKKLWKQLHISALHTKILFISVINQKTVILGMKARKGKTRT